MQEGTRSRKRRINIAIAAIAGVVLSCFLLTAPVAVNVDDLLIWTPK